MFGPPVTLRRVTREADELRVSVAIGSAPERTYAAWTHPSEPTASIDEKLFFELSALSVRRYGDCGRYHLELCFLLGAIGRGETQELPVVLGATRFARPPTKLRWITNHIARWIQGTVSTSATWRS